MDVSLKSRSSSSSNTMTSAFYVNIDIGSWNLVFHEKTLYGNSNVVLDINQEYLIPRLKQNVSPISFDSTLVPYPLGFEMYQTSSFGFRLLEISAFRFFHHALARAPIVNDSMYTGDEFHVSLSQKLHDVFHTDKNMVYNDYVIQHDRNEIPFNFDGMEFDLIMNFSSNTIPSSVPSRITSFSELLSVRLFSSL